MYVCNDVYICIYKGLAVVTLIIRVCVCTYVYASTYVCMYWSVYMYQESLEVVMSGGPDNSCLCMYVCMYVCIEVDICIY